MYICMLLTSYILLTLQLLQDLPTFPVSHPLSYLDNSLISIRALHMCLCLGVGPSSGAWKTTPWFTVPGFFF